MNFDYLTSPFVLWSDLMKPLLIVFCICLQIFVANVAQARSAIDAYRTDSETLFRCLWVAAGSEENQEEQKESNTDEEEEPDCD